MGRYLLVLPTLRGIQALQLILRPNAACSADINAFAVRLLHRHVSHLFGATPGLGNATSGGGNPQEEFLNDMAKVSSCLALCVAWPRICWLLGCVSPCCTRHSLALEVAERAFNQ